MSLEQSHEVRRWNFENTFCGLCPSLILVKNFRIEALGKFRGQLHLFRSKFVKVKRTRRRNGVIRRWSELASCEGF